MISEGRETKTYSHKLPESIRNNAVLIDEKLADITVCDPAVGSGAFPVGMMSEIVRVRNVLSLYVDQASGLSDPRQDACAYKFKRRCIEHSLYGVDIDPGAVEIAKLRLWLSLIVDEDDIKNIKPLPNLDYKIVCGNSLLGVEKNLFNNELFNELEKLKPLFFNETNPTKKQEYKKQIDALISKITNGNTEFDFEVYFSEVFHEEGGFDVVIANPPYDVYEGHRKDEITQIRALPRYDIAKGGKLNAYKIFLAKSITLQKQNGILCEIFQNSFLTDNSAKNIRNYFLRHQRILRIDSFPERDDTQRRVFENAKMSVCILLSASLKLDQPYLFDLNIWEDKHLTKAKKITFTNMDIIKFDEENAPIPLISEKELPILRKLSLFPKFKEFSFCYQGEINLTVHKRLLYTVKKQYAPVVKGAAIQKWHTVKKMSQGETVYLDEKTYLMKNKGAKSRHHNLKRIVTQGITGVDEKIRLKATYLNEGTYCAHSTNYVMINDGNIRYHYLLALLNSSILNWYFKVFSTNSNVNSYEVNNLPVCKIPSTEEEFFMSLVNQILDITKDEDYLQNPAERSKVEFLQAEIDQLVYKLYGLTEEEINIVEGGK